jgi:hypothetical protein
VFAYTLCHFAMDEYTADAFVNRDDPIPVIVFDGSDGLSDEHEELDVKEGKRQRLRKHLSKQNIKHKMTRAHEAGSSMQDRLLER